MAAPETFASTFASIDAAQCKVAVCVDFALPQIREFHRVYPRPAASARVVAMDLLWRLLLLASAAAALRAPRAPLQSPRRRGGAYLSARSSDAVPAADAAAAEASYRRGLATIGGITVVFASNSPVLHAATGGANAPPVLLLNAACAALALGGLLVGGRAAAALAPTPAAAAADAAVGLDGAAWRAGGELGLWKFCGATANLYGLSLTSADHGAFLVQLTTLLVPLAQGVRGVPIPRRIWAAVALALAGVLLFTRDPAAAATAASDRGDALCALAAVFYATYDLRLFEAGKAVPPLALITTKIACQAALSAAAAVLFVDASDAAAFLAAGDATTLAPLLAAALWSGVGVNALASVLQVSGQQAVGPARAQVIYAAQPLAAAVLSLVFLHETVGVEGAAGGVLFIGATFLAATAPLPDPNCAADVCEV